MTVMLLSRYDDSDFQYAECPGSALSPTGRYCR